MRVEHARLASVYSEHGFAVARNLLPLERIETCRGELLRLVQRRLELLGRQSPTRDLDKAFDYLCDIDRSHGGEIYRVATDLPGYQQLVFDPGLTATVKSLMATELIQLPFHNSNLRIDRPSEDQYLFDWHQDYTFNLLSKNAVTAVIPLSDISPDMGALCVVPGSHRKIAEVAVNAPDFSSGHGGGGYIFTLHHPRDELEERAVCLPLHEGDVLLLHCLLIHRSGHNRSRRNRWTINPRYSDFLDEKLVARGWARGIQPGRVLFGDVHPDKVVK